MKHRIAPIFASFTYAAALTLLSGILGCSRDESSARPSRTQSLSSTNAAPSPATATATATATAEPARLTFTVNYAQTPFKAALKDFETRSGLKLGYADKLVADAPPVTLRSENAPAEKVLLELLRPQGLEAIMTDKNLAAIVPAYSDQGMAKAFGRALATGLRLANKLDGAKVEGDEVKVPGWTSEDDEDLALGITDLFVSITYANSRSRTGGQVDQEERVEAIRALLHSADPLVRAGAMTLLANYSVMDGGIRQFGREIEQGFADPHPVVRTASAIQFAAGLGKNVQWQDQKSSAADAAATLRKLAADPEAGVRMAAAFALRVDYSRGMPVDPDGAVLDQLLADRSAFLRQTLRLVTMADSSSLDRMPEGPVKAKWLALNADDGLKATLRDPNPIARAVSFAFAQMVQMGQQRRDKAAPRDRIAEIWTEAELAKDPWMKMVHGLLTPALSGDYSVAIEKVVAAAGSDKPSHLMAAALTLGAGSRIYGRGMPQAAARGEKPAPPKIPDLVPLIARLSSSQWLWARLSGIAVNAYLPFVGPMSATPLTPEALKAAETRISAALASPEEPVRLVALIAHYGRTTVGLLPSPEPILAALHSRSVPEMLLGAQCAGRCLAPDQLLKEVEFLLADPSRRVATETLLGGIWINTALRKLAPAAKLAFARQLAELVIARQDPAFEIALFENLEQCLRDSAQENPQLAELILTKASLEAIAARYRNGVVRDTEAPILLNRLKSAAADPAKRTAVLTTWAALADRLYNLPARENPAAILSLLEQAMAGEPANAREAAARLRALPRLISASPRLIQGTGPLPTHVAKAFERALASAGEPVPSTESVAVLVATISHLNSATMVLNGKKSIPYLDAWTTNHPALIQAMNGAVQKILAGNREEAKVQVWCALARSGDKLAVEALAERILDGRMPDQMLPNVMNTAAANPDLVPPAFAPALLKLVRDPAQSLDRRCALISGLNMFPNYSRRLAGEIEALAWDDKLDPKLRSQALQSLAYSGSEAAKPALIQKVLKDYDTLPVEMAANLGSLAYNQLATPGAEELLVRVIEDKRLRGENGWMTFHSLFFGLQYAQGLDKLKAPDRLRQALDKLEKEWPAERRSEFQGHVLPRLQELRKKLDPIKPAVNKHQP
jgi:hypothetical protein